MTVSSDTWSLIETAKPAENSGRPKILPFTQQEPWDFGNPRVLGRDQQEANRDDRPAD